MTPDILKSLVPFGIIGLAIVSVALLAQNPKGGGNRWLAVLAMVLIGALAVFDKVYSTPVLQPAPPVPRASGAMNWTDTGAIADWGGRDWASTSGQTPKYTVKGMALCDENHSGSIAVCWPNRPNGYPPGIDASDITGSPQQWCTYKDASIKLFTPPDGKAPAGRVYVCSLTIPR
jgi:hypothetical protein